MKEVVDVNTGEVKLGTGEEILRSVAIGSCIVVAACDFKKKTGALAHIMLPGRAGARSQEKTKYAADAIEEMVNKMTDAGTSKDDIEVCLIGGANILKNDDDTICSENIRSTTELLKERQIPIKATVLGGEKRKGVCLDIESSTVFYTEGDEKEKFLWKACDKSGQAEIP
ncbi:MAG TPA: chemotaxis protein CheD [Sedimentisphaerales bacterium]|nr:chemotaxis protein CheD [Sedimentisphaerales bacterium]